MSPAEPEAPLRHPQARPLGHTCIPACEATGHTGTCAMPVTYAQIHSWHTHPLPDGHADGPKRNTGHWYVQVCTAVTRRHRGHGTQSPLTEPPTSCTQGRCRQKPHDLPTGTCMHTPARARKHRPRPQCARSSVRGSHGGTGFRGRVAAPSAQSSWPSPHAPGG